MFKFDWSNVAHTLVDDPRRHQATTGRAQIGDSDMFSTPSADTVENLGVYCCKYPLGVRPNL